MLIGRLGACFVPWVGALRQEYDAERRPECEEYGVRVGGGGGQMASLPPSHVGNTLNKRSHHPTFPQVGGRMEYSWTNHAMATMSSGISGDVRREASSFEN